MRSFPLKSGINLCALGLLVSSGAAHANFICQVGAICLQDGNANFEVDVTNAGGVQKMVVDGLDHIFVQDFIHDVTHINGSLVTVKGATRQEIGMIDPGTNGGIWLTNPTISQTGSNQLTLGYVSTDVAISISFELVGGALGSNASKIIETYTITNTNASAITVNLFAFTDVDLGYDHMDDRGELLGSAPYTSYRQFDDQFQMIATTDSAPNHYMVGYGEGGGPGGSEYEIMNQLWDTTNTYFNNTVRSGPADLQMVAQWVQTLAPGASFSYTHTLEVCPIEGCPPAEVPVPAAVWLLGSGLLGLVGVARRKRTTA